MVAIFAVILLVLGLQNRGKHDAVHQMLRAKTTHYH